MDDELLAQLKRVADALEALVNRYNRLDTLQDQEEAKSEKRREAWAAYLDAKRAYLDGETSLLTFHLARDALNRVEPGFSDPD